MDIKGHYIKSNPKEITLGEWELISATLEDQQLDAIERYGKMFTQLGLPTDVLNDLELPEFFKYCQQFNEDTAVDDAKFLKDFEVGGYSYVAFDALKVKDIKIIEKYMQSGKPYAGELMAVCFKRTDLSDKEHYDKAHIEYKAKLFRQHLTVDMCLPYIMRVVDLIMQSIKVTTDVEQSNG
jgi:hypothetical protein